jgi:predicted secreted protein
MPFDTPLALAIYCTIWWVTLFTVLPFQIRSQHEEGGGPEGTDPGAPVAPRMWKKAGITTVIASVIFAIVCVVAARMD